MSRCIFDWPLVNGSSGNRIKRMFSKIWATAQILYFSTRGTAVRILKAIRFFLIRDGSFRRGQPPISVTGHWRFLSYMYMLKKLLLDRWNLLCAIGVPLRIVRQLLKIILLPACSTQLPIPRPRKKKLIKDYRKFAIVRNIIAKGKNILVR